ncbi:hypothetical protein ACFWOT_18835 [Streptomyces sp. NPDC058440]|uniref:hypothetical protein n=1 Tax=Streptomyces sp. NPDC058440 TaxID=3346501 RepID=UPI00365D5FB2
MRIATTFAAVSVATLVFSGQAEASAPSPGTTKAASCSTTGARGSVGVTSPTGDLWNYGTFKLAMSVSDTAADGHHVQIRFLSKEVDLTGGRIPDRGDSPTGLGFVRQCPGTA